jgi:hypothetical protein
MILNIKAELKTLSGAQILHDDGVAVTLQWVAIQCILSPKNASDMKSDEKVKLYSIAQKLDRNEIEYTVEEIATIKKHIGDHPSVLIVGQCFDIIEKGEK